MPSVEGDRDNDNSDDADDSDGTYLSDSCANKHMKRVNVQIPDEIHTRAKVIAVLKGTTLNEYLEQAIREAVDRDKKTLKNL
ncbi:hypothetical protein GOV11_03050 [Candidatus Woesearchaeota archaeon]|nr:hypothetical protein [Candidatus Woesearchaeota archaeon]